MASGVFRPRSAVSLSTLCRLGVAVDLSSVVMAMDTSEVHSFGMVCSVNRLGNAQPKTLVPSAQGGI